MSIMNKIGGTITTKSQDLTKKAKDMAELTRLNGLVNDATQRLEHAYASLGKQMFSFNPDCPSAEYEETYMLINSTLAEIDNYRNDIMKIKNVRVCPDCGAQVPANAQFCNGCGRKLESLTAETPQRQLFCPECGGKLDEGSVFCPNCGHKL